MKQKLLLSLSLLLAVSSYVKAQSPCPNVRYIEVNGKAEKEISVNELYVQITLKEYYKEPKSQKGKVLISSLENQLQKAVLNAGIPSQDLTISNISSYNNYYDNKKNKASEYLASKQYLLKLHSISTMQRILSQLDAKGISNTYVNKYSNTEIKNYQQSLQKEAFLDAKQKAMHIASVAGARLGKVLEVHSSGYIDDPSYRPLAMMRASANGTTEDADPDINFKNIKIRDEQRVLFELL